MSQNPLNKNSERKSNVFEYRHLECWCKGLILSYLGITLELKFWEVNIHIWTQSDLAGRPMVKPVAQAMRVGIKRRTYKVDLAGFIHWHIWEKSRMDEISH